MIFKLRKRKVSKNSPTHRRNKRVYQTIVVIIIVFWITWLPLLVFTIYEEISTLKTQNSLTYAILRLLAGMNTVINPYLYGYLNTSVKLYYKKVYRKLPWYTTTNPEQFSMKVTIRRTNFY